MAAASSQAGTGQTEGHAKVRGLAVISGRGARLFQKPVKDREQIESPLIPAAFHMMTFLLFRQDPLTPLSTRCPLGC